MIKTLFLILAAFTLSAQEAEFEDYLQKVAEKFPVQQAFADSINPDSVLLLDTREKEEFEISHIRGARWAGYDDFSLDNLRDVEKSEPIVVYCSVGYRSSVVAVKLMEAGYKEVRNLYGGIFRWANEHRALFNDTTQTNKLHTYNERWGRFVTAPEIVKVTKK